MKVYLFLTVMCLSVFSTIFGQQTEAQRVQQEREAQARQQRTYEFENRMKQQADQMSRDNAEGRRNPYHQPPYRQPSEKEIKQMKVLLAPSSEDFAKYENFLRQPNTGLFRLTPDFDCNQKYVVRVDGDCENSMFIGNFYSFRRKDYSNGVIFDLTFKDEELRVGGLLSQDILVSLGDVQLEDISTDSNGLKFLLDFKPQKESLKIKKQSAEFKQGIKVEGFTYGKSEKAVINTTYALRTIAYRANPLKFSALKWDKRVDLTTVFRIVRKDNDGSLIILWKALNKQDAPKITFSKGEAPMDFNQVNSN